MKQENNNQALEEIRKQLIEKSIPQKAAFFPRFFKTGPGEYGEGDKFIGVTVPVQRSIAKEFYNDVSLKTVIELLHSEWHEERLTALFILNLKFIKSDDHKKSEIVEAYLANTKYVNNWDLVDSSAPYILGVWLGNKERTILYTLAKSESLWERRISIISTLMFIRNGHFEDTINLAEQLLFDSHDLMHKAVGWCLREVGKKDYDLLISFLNKYAATMPRTTLRYSIERLPDTERKHYLGLKHKNITTGN